MSGCKSQTYFNQNTTNVNNALNDENANNPLHHEAMSNHAKTKRQPVLHEMNFTLTIRADTTKDILYMYTRLTIWPSKDSEIYKQNLIFLEETQAEVLIYDVVVFLYIITKYYYLKRSHEFKQH